MMKKVNLLLCLFICLLSPMWMQASSLEQLSPPSLVQPSPHRIIFQLTTDDTLAHKALMKQLTNIKINAPDASVEVVCHGPGVYMMVEAKSTVKAKIKELSDKGIRFVVCEFTLKDRNIDKSAIVKEAGFVKSGILEIVSKQEEGWSYLKAGF